ncbi:zinc-ribbon domain-containing protein [Intrasporangium sp. DVR]|uniref:zinc-ribbon domain-containing protein n=1 Tax=Intrasporangium sp. DVR TaxID=3127867 RepID=UPI00333E7F3E
MFGSLAWLDPELAAEWHEDNDLTPWHVKPFSAGVVAKWRCAANPEHVWDAAVIDRSSGRLCPLCSTAGTSMIEKAFLAAAQSLDPDAHAARIDRWRVDVLIPSARLVVEYDGEYWHSEKQETDSRKTAALIQAGYCVARIRENSLPHLDLHSSRLRQVSFRPGFGSVDQTMRELVTWATDRA